MYDRIVVPTDGSDEMGRVLAHAADLACIHGATLDFVYVVNTATFANLPMETSWEGVRESLREEGEAALEGAETAVEGTAEEVSTERHTLEGGPAREIVAYAERTGADLVVMGTHGRGGINRILIGSVAERVVRTSTVPVLTVHVDDAEGGGGG